MNPATTNTGGFVGDLASQVQDFARKNFPETFTGVSLDGGAVVVHRVPQPDGTLDKAMTERFPAQSVRFADAPRSEAELHALTQRIVADWKRWSTEGIAFSTVGPDIRRGVVVVGAHDPDRVRAQILERYGDAVVVEPGPTVIPASMTTTR